MVRKARQTFAGAVSEVLELREIPTNPRLRAALFEQIGVDSEAGETILRLRDTLTRLHSEAHGAALRKGKARARARRLAEAEAVRGNK